MMMVCIEAHATGQPNGLLPLSHSGGGSGGSWGIGGADG
eukprot:COSAG06_NODE_2678_length_6460_cov_2.134884_5_plen_39_part_00